MTTLADDYQQPRFDIDELACYGCTREAGGDVSGDDHPVRAVVGQRKGRGADPHMVYTLTCGHGII